MSYQKKNVIQEFMKTDYIPTSNQFLVKYCSGKGNNLHEVECVDGSTMLVSMPKKFRQTIWLKRDDCLVIDPIEEGKKVKGEIVCVLCNHSVREMISNKQWPQNSQDIADTNTEILLQFFGNSAEPKSKNEDDFAVFSSSDSSSGDEDEEEEENFTNCQNAKIIDTDELVENLESNQGNDKQECTREKNRSRVQLISSGVVTVTNVIITEGLENDIQSLEFEADEEESSDELYNISRNLERHANTIRIQVNYNNVNTNACAGSGTSHSLTV